MGENSVDSDSYYKKYEEQYSLDHEIHDRMIARIDGILGSGSPEGYEEIGRIIEESNYTRVCEYFGDLKDFRSSYVIYTSEIRAGAECCIYAAVKSISEYSLLRLSLLYLFRRIQLLMDKDDIESAYSEVRDYKLSPFFILGMLKEMDVWDKGYVGKEVAKLFATDGRECDAKLFESMCGITFESTESTASFENDVAEKTYDKKICFITCVNNDRMYQECLFYINRLVVPDGVYVDTICICEAESMTSGYNAAMEASDADIKIYIHQDVCVINPYFLLDIMDIFDSDENISLIGMVGSPKLPEDAVMWHGARVGKLYRFSDNIIFTADSHGRYSGVTDVEAVDGLMIVTNRDIRWREDLFDGWDFYDASECAEHRKQGYRIVVPDQNAPWVIHDDGIMNLYNYGKYRDRYIEEYNAKAQLS